MAAASGRCKCVGVLGVLPGPRSGAADGQDQVGVAAAGEHHLDGEAAAVVVVTERCFVDVDGEARSRVAAVSVIAGSGCVVVMVGLLDARVIEGGRVAGRRAARGRADLAADGVATIAP